jgi:hypothetical protein
MVAGAEDDSLRASSGWARASLDENGSMDGLRACGIGFTLFMMTLIYERFPCPS